MKNMFRPSAHVAFLRALTIRVEHLEGHQLNSLTLQSLPLGS